MRGLEFIYEPEYLRFFQARFEPVSPAGLFSDNARPERALAMATSGY